MEFMWRGLRRSAFHAPLNPQGKTSKIDPLTLTEFPLPGWIVSAHLHPFQYSRNPDATKPGGIESTEQTGTGSRREISRMVHYSHNETESCARSRWQEIAWASSDVADWKTGAESLEHVRLLRQSTSKIRK